MFSAVHPTTDIAKILRHVRFVPARSGHQRQLILSEMPDAQAARTSKSVSAPVHPSIAR